MMRTWLTRTARGAAQRLRAAARMRVSLLLAAVAVAALVAVAARVPAQEIFPPAAPIRLAPRIPRDTLVTAGRGDHAILVFYGLRAVENRTETEQVAPNVQAAMKREKGLDAALSPSDGMQGGGVRQLGTLGDAALRPASGESAAWPRDIYAIDLPESDARFVFVNTSLLLAKEPTAADEARALHMLLQLDSAFVVSRRFRFLMIEQPLFGSGPIEKNWASADLASFAGRNRSEILAVCDRRRVTAVIAGTDRLYQRLWVKSAAVGAGGFWHITTAGAGRALDAFRPIARDQGLNLAMQGGLTVSPATVRTEKIAHYCRIELPHKQGAVYTGSRFDVYRVRSKKKVELLEHLDLEKGP